LTTPPIIAGFSPLNRKDKEGDACGDRKLLMQHKSIEAAIIAFKCVFFLARRATKIEIGNGVMPQTAGAAWMTLADF
jgi:hypothetical protein